MEFREEIALCIVKRYGHKMKEFSHAKFWGLANRKNGGIITLVVRQIDAGNKHFFSIY